MIRIYEGDGSYDMYKVRGSGPLLYSSQDGYRAIETQLSAVTLSMFVCLIYFAFMYAVLLVISFASL